MQPTELVIVTGATGFIGRALVASLMRRGYRVCAIDQFPHEGANLEPSVAGAVVWRVADVTQVQALDDALDGIRPSLVFHLAGGRSAEREEATRLNVTSTRALLQVLEKRGATSLVLASTGEVYGRAPVPFREAGPTMPSTAYGWSKLEAEGLVLEAGQRGPVRSVVARMAVVYGPNQRGSMLVPDAVETLARGEILQLNGGTQTRDFVFIDDAVEALVRLAESPASNGHVVNVSTGIATKVIDVARSIAVRSGRSADAVVTTAGRDPGVMEYCLDPSLLLELTAFRPMTSLDEGLAATVGHRASR